MYTAGIEAACELYGYKTAAPKCDVCSSPSTKKILWCEGRAYVPACDKHVQKVVHKHRKLFDPVGHPDGIKEARHALDRLHERTTLDPEIIPQLDAEADRLSDHLAPGHYFLPLKDTTGTHVGFAAFKTVPGYPNQKLILATILGPQMKPKGTSLSDRMAHPKFKSYLREQVKEALLTTELQPHQQRVVDRMANPDQRGLIVHHGLGSGKTLTSIAVADRLGLPADVITPAALQDNYHKEVTKHTDASPDILQQSLENVARKGGHSLKRPLLVVDEAHRTRNPGKTQAALMKSPAEKRLLLTGSLLYNQPSDIAGPVNLVAGDSTLPSNPSEFDRYFVETTQKDPNFLMRMFGAQPKVESRLNPNTKPYLRDVLRKYVDYHPSNTADFPERQDATIRVPMASKQREIYDAILGTAPQWVQDKVRGGMPPTKAEVMQLNSFLTGTRQAANTTAPFRTKEPQYQPKIDAALKELQKVLDTNPRAKAVVYSNYLDAGINPYKKQLEDAQIPYGEFTGAMPKAQRDQLVRDYNENRIRALLLSSAGGEGLDLKGTRLLQILEPHWNEEKLKQVIGRGIRYKSHSDLPPEEQNVTVQRFLSTLPRKGIAERLHLKRPSQSVDEYLYGLAQDKERLNAQFRKLLTEGN